MDAGLLALCQCPRCAGALVAGASGPRCTGCGKEFPTVQGIPCLFVDPEHELAEWRRQIGVYRALLQRGIDAMGEQLQSPDLLALTRRRLERLRGATVENGDRLMTMLSGAGLEGTAPAGDRELEAGFTFIEYYEHILRDWSWDGDSTENARARDLVLEALGEDRQLGRVLVLGAGGCRLAYDLHMKCKPALTVALDMSPLFLIAAKRVMFGTGLRFYEFPVQPRDFASVCVERELRAPSGAPQGLHLVLADAFTPPLRPGAFDTVITPWFIDIVPVDVRETLGLVHRLLADGGRWIDYGPLSYGKQRPYAHRYTPEELARLVELAGFASGQVREEQVDLLRSKAAANGRQERVLTFVARKTAPATTAGPGEPPPWLMFPHVPIPKLPGLDGFRAEHPVLAFVARAIDGVATLGDISARMVKELGARPDAALPGTRALVTMVWRELSPDGRS